MGNNMNMMGMQGRMGYPNMMGNFNQSIPQQSTNSMAYMLNNQNKMNPSGEVQKYMASNVMPQGNPVMPGPNMQMMRMNQQQPNMPNFNPTQM